MLDSDEDVTCRELATRIVDGYLAMFQRELEPTPTPFHLGQGYKVPWSARVHFPAWTDGELVWWVTADSQIGWFGKVGSSMWSILEPSRARTGAPGTNAADWQVDDRVSMAAGSLRFRVVAVADKCVLLQSMADGTYQGESNAFLAKYYKRER